jgi:predicted RecA/RadA family phage recombinase
MKRVVGRLAILALVLAASLAVPLPDAGGGVDVAAAQSGSSMLVNETVAVGNDTSTAYAELDPADGNVSESATANVTFARVWDNGTVINQSSKTLSLDSDGSADLVTYVVSDTDKNASEIRVFVEGNASNIEAAGVEVGTYEQVAAGGGGLFGGSDGSVLGLSLPVFAVLAVVALFLLGGD